VGGLITLDLGNPPLPKAADPGTGSPLDDRMYARSGGGGPSLAGVIVSAEGALRVSAVYRGVSILANLLGWIPKGIFEYVDEDTRRRAPEHPLHAVVSRRPNKRQSAFEFWRLLATWLVLRGRAYAQIVYEGGELQLVPLHPDRMYGPDETAGGELRYWYQPKKGPRIPLIAGEDVWVLNGLSEDGIRGLAMIDLGRDTLGISSAATQHAALFYDRGANFAGVLKHPRRLKPETAKAMSENFGTYYGGRRGTSTTPVLWEGMEFQNISMTNKDAEFIESLKFFGIGEVARWLGLPPHLLADVEKSTSWGSGIEEQRSDMTTFTFLPWAELIQAAVQKDLIAEPERYYMRCNLNALLKGKTSERYQVYEIGIRSGILSPNEARRMEEMSPREGGDVYVQPTSPQKSAGEPTPGQGDPPPPPKKGAAEPNPDEEQALRKGPNAVTRWAVAKMVVYEREQLASLAKGHAGQPLRWRNAVASFYGRYAAMVTEAFGTPSEAARAYCDAGRDVVLARGARALEKWETDRAPQLLRLAQGDEA
jgi:HK97 family phage portal protein